MELEDWRIKEILTQCGFDWNVLKNFSYSVTELYNLMLFLIGIPQVFNQL